MLKVKEVQKMKFVEKSQLAHNIARNLEGDYSVRLKLAWQYINNIDSNDIYNNKNIDVINSLINKPKKLNGKNDKKEVEKIENEEDIIEKYDLATIEKSYQQLPSNVYEILEVDEVLQLDTFFKQRIENEFGNDLASHTNITKAYEELAQANTRQAVQAITLSYLLDNRIKASIYKLVNNGFYYKSLERREVFESEQTAREFFYGTISDGKKSKVEYNEEDVFHMVISDSLRLEFQTLFTDKFYMDLFFRSRNALRNYFNRAKKEAEEGNFTISTSTLARNAESGNESELVDIILTENEERNGNLHDTMNTKQRYEFYSQLVDKIDEIIPTITNFEKELLKYQLQGYSKNEIYKIVGRRVDRHFNNLRDKFVEHLNITNDEFKKLYTDTKRNLAS